MPSYPSPALQQLLILELRGEVPGLRIEESDELDEARALRPNGPRASSTVDPMQLSTGRRNSGRYASS